MGHREALETAQCHTPTYYKMGGAGVWGDAQTILFTAERKAVLLSLYNGSSTDISGQFQSWF